MKIPCKLKVKKSFIDHETLELMSANKELDLMLNDGSSEELKNQINELIKKSNANIFHSGEVKLELYKLDLDKIEWLNQKIQAGQPITQKEFDNVMNSRILLLNYSVWITKQVEEIQE